MTDADKAMAIARRVIGEGLSVNKLSREIGVSRPAMSRWLNEPGYPRAAVATAILARYAKRMCAFDGEEKTLEACQIVAHRPQPHGFPESERLWNCCQACEHKPVTPQIKTVTAPVGRKGGKA